VILGSLFETNKSSVTVLGDDLDSSAIPTTTEQEEQIVTSYTIFLSPSPVNYTFNDIENKNSEMTRLEISFAAAIVSHKSLEIINLNLLLYRREN